jgi:hypothetical protein
MPQFPIKRFPTVEIFVAVLIQLNILIGMDFI